MEFKILGPLQIRANGRPIEPAGARQRTLLAILLLHRREVVPAERLIEELYGDAPPPSAATALRAHVSRLRGVLGDASLLVTRAGGYVLELDAGALDAERFQRLLEAGRAQRVAGNTADAAATLRDALELWRGPPLADFAYDEFAQAEISRLEELRRAALEERIDADLALGRHADLAGELEALVHELPLREGLRGQLMLALYRSGRQADALAVYQEGRRQLDEQLGLVPGKPLRELERAILAHDPELDLPAVAESVSGTSTAGFVGRERELEELRARLEDALAGRGRLMLVAGEPGIGKSRLAEEIAAQARAREARVLVGRCWEAGGAPAFWPWVQSLRVYVRECDREVLHEQLGSGAPDLAQLLPELHELFPGLPTPPSLESEGARFRLFDATAAFLTNAARAQPLVVVLDDLHAADEPSLLLLRFLARELGDSRLLVVGLYRDIDPTLREPLALTVAELTREQVTSRLHLKGLAPSEVGDFVELASEATPSDELVAAIYDETAGNPLFVGEIVRLLAAEGRLREPGARLSIPDGVREAIERRVRRLGDGTQELLTRASILGREFELEALAHYSEQPAEHVVSLLDEAMVERIVDRLPGARGRLRFAHVLIRDTLYDGLSPVRQMQLHREAGEALERVYAAALEPHLAEIALHFAASAPAGTTGQAIAYARRAGDRAVELLAFEEAVRLYETALALVTDRTERCGLLLALGDAQARAGNTPTAKEAYRDAAELAAELGLSEQLARAALGYGGRMVWDVSRDDSDLVPLLERALAAIGREDSASRARLLARLAGGPLRDASIPTERKAPLAAEGLEVARRIGDPATLAYALSGYLAATDSPDRTRINVDLSTELIEVATAVGDLERAIEGYENRSDCLLELGDVRGAADDIVVMASLAAELHQPVQDWYVAVKHATRALFEGRLAEAEALIGEAFAVGEVAVSWNAAEAFSLQTYVLRRDQGRLAEVEELVRQAADDYATYPIWRSVLVHMTAHLGYEDEAREELEALRSDGFTALSFDEMWLVSMSFLAEGAAALGDANGAGRLYELLRPYADRVAVAYPELATGSVARYLGLLATTLERWDDAERHFEDALETNHRIGARPSLVRTRHDYSRLLRQRGDAVRAGELERAARELANEIGMALGA